jgi:hypothetical protein
MLHIHTYKAARVRILTAWEGPEAGYEAAAWEGEMLLAYVICRVAQVQAKDGPYRCSQTGIRVSFG